MYAFSVSCQSSKAQYLHSALESDTRRHAAGCAKESCRLCKGKSSHDLVKLVSYSVGCLENGEGGWWSSGGREEGLEMIAAEPASVL